MTATRKILAGIFAFLFVTSGFAAMLFFNIERKAFSAETYKQAFKQQGLYNDMTGLFIEAILTPAEGTNDMFALLSGLDRDELELVVSILLPPQELEILTDDLFDSAIPFLNGDADSITVSLGSLKRNITGEGGTRAITLILQAQPDCSTEQLLLMGLGALSGNGSMTLCKPPEAMIGLVMPLIETQLQFIANGLPDELSVLSAGQIEATRDFRTRLNRIRTGMKLSLLLPLVFLLAVTFLAVRSLDDWLRWWGIPLLIIGVLGTLTALVAAPLVPSIVETLFLQGESEMPVVFQELMRNMAGSLTREILRPVAAQGIILLLTGAVMVVTNAFMNRNR